MKDSKGVYGKIKVISNKPRFRIIELTQEKQLSITELSTMLKLSYTKCADYVTLLEKDGLVEKIRDGKEVRVKSKVKIKDNQIEFL
jgi:predicted transcriptional regulator